MTLVLAACSNQKNPAPAAGMRASALASAPADQVMAAWSAKVRAAPKAGPVKALYRGSSWLESVRAAEALGARLGVISAGLGYVDAETAAPSYGLTVARGDDDSIDAKIDGAFDAAAWWALLSAARLCGPDLLSALEAEDGLVLVALPEGYLTMVSKDLAASRPAVEGRLRIFTRGRVPAPLVPHLMPYDDRLDGKGSAWRGTQTNAAPRALRHFAEEIYPRAADDTAAVHAAHVIAALAGLEAPTRINRTAKTDPEIKALLVEHWNAGRGVPSRLLRILRDDLLVACEQGRAKRLVAEVAAERMTR